MLCLITAFLIAEEVYYTLGEEDGSWQEVKDETEREAKITREIQRRLRKKLVDSLTGVNKRSSDENSGKGEGRKHEVKLDKVFND